MFRYTDWEPIYGRNDAWIGIKLADYEIWLETKWA